MKLDATIRQATPDDADGLAELHLRSARAGFRNIFSESNLHVSHKDMVADWLTRLRDDPLLRRITLVAEVGGSIVGVIIAGPDPLDPAVGRVSRLYVDPRYWNYVVARRLLAACLAHLREVQCTVARGWIMEPNLRAQAIVKRIGARPTGARQPTCEMATLMSDGVEDIEYELVL